jgi:predicted transcriptional regulator
MGRKNRKRYRTSLVHYHLRKLELSGLVTTTIVHGKKRSKLIYRNVDYRVKFKFRQNAGQMG